MITKKQLEQQRARLEQSSPDLTQVLRGSLFERRRRCGVPTCHCATGTGHPVVCVGVALPGGKNVQVTVPRELLPVVRQWTENYRQLWEVIEGVSAVNRELLRRRLLGPPAGTSARKRRRKRSPGEGA
jgi:hypothetical protein